MDQAEAMQSNSPLGLKAQTSIGLLCVSFRNLASFNPDEQLHKQHEQRVEMLEILWPDHKCAYAIRMTALGALLSLLTARSLQNTIFIVFTK